MEITNITGPDVVPAGFSHQPPRQQDEQPVRPEEYPVNRTPESTENNTGTRVDTYA